MNYKLYTTSISAWHAMISAIDQAKKCIYIEMYIFSDDMSKKHDFIGKLKRKARSGVRVIIVADSFGSSVLKKELATATQKSGIEFLFFSNWLRHIHRKILIVDEKIAFIGGVNIGKRFARWNDLQLRLSGHTVKRILRSFAYTYEMAGGKDKKILKHREKQFTAKLKFWVIEHLPTRNIHTLKSLYVEKITRAEKSIQIASPYFTPPRWLISLLDDAINRKVRVEILIPQKVDWKIMNVLNYRYMYNLCPLGIHFYLGKKMNHAKLLIIDGEEAVIGSQNMDLLSFGINYEAGIFFKEKKLIQEVTQVLEKWKRKSRKFKAHHYRMKMLDYLILALMKIMRPIL